MERKQLLLIACILALLGGIFLLKKGKKSEESTLNSPISDKVTILTETNSDEVTKSLPPEKVQKILAWSSAERKAFLKRAPLNIRNGTALIKINVSLLKRCMAGDLDAIRLDFKSDKQKRLKISFENLETEKEVGAFELPDNFFAKDSFDFQISVPVSETPGQYGFFVCSTTNTQKCSVKDSTDINNIFVEHYNNKNLTPKDRLYFFQFTLIDNRGMAAFSVHPKGDQPFQEIDTYLHDRGISSTVSKNTLEKSKKWTHTLGSLPVKFTSDSIRLEIPQYSEDACAQIPIEK